MQIERKEFTLEKVDIKGGGAEGGPGSISFYASTFGNWDRVRPVPEKPAKGAFDKSLPMFVKDGFIAIGHEHGRLPIASVKSAHADDYGLLVEAEFHSTPEAQQARTVAQERLSRGKSVKTSIGYVVKRDDTVDMDDMELKESGIRKGRLLTEIDLLEVSLVNIPANPLASVTGVKGLLPDGMTLSDEIDTVLAAVKDVTERAKDVNALRTKEGRVLSAANREKLSALLDALNGLDSLKAEIAALLDATQPAKSLQDDEEINRIFAKLMATKQGVTLKWQ